MKKLELEAEKPKSYIDALGREVTTERAKQ
jgi:hypothetical protein